MNAQVGKELTITITAHQAYPSRFTVQSRQHREVATGHLLAYSPTTPSTERRKLTYAALLVRVQIAPTKVLLATRFRRALD